MKNTIQALAALAQESRLAIFRLLVVAGPDGMPVGKIAEQLSLANATLSFHLKELTNAGLTKSTPNGLVGDWGSPPQPWLVTICGQVTQDGQGKKIELR